MIKLMVVDDELVIREGIETAVDWERLDIQVVGTAGNGRDGMAKALAQKPDIVITDIRMPVMDGIHFAKELKEKLPNVRIVFLTGYSEFEYAREAIRIGAAEYLLKPINTGELTELVGRLADEIRRENATVMNRNRETVLLKENLPMMRNRCVKRFFQGELGRGPFVERAGALGMELTGPQYQVIILCIDYYYQLIANGEREAGLLKYAMSNIAEEVLSASGRPVVCDEGEARLMVLLNTVEDTRGIARGCKEVQFCMRKYYGVSVSVGIGKKVGSLQELWQSYKAADEAVEARIKQGSSQIIVKDDETGNASDRTRLFLTPEEEQELSDAVKLLDKNRVYDALELIFEKYVMQQDIGRKGIEQLCMYLVLIAMRQLEHFSILPEQALGKNYYYYDEISKYETAEDLEMWMKDIYSSSLVALEQQSNHKYKGIVAGGIAYAMEHFAESVSVGDVAQAVYVTPNYFSKVFKEETGENFTDWLNKYRIEQAKKRMDAEPEAKVYTIAEETGFSDYKYFAFIFKKYTGYTPTSYRNR